MKKLFNKLFIGGDWQVKVFAKNNSQIIKPQKGYWYGDPFLFSHNDELFLFVEAFHKKKELGYIGYLSSNDGFNKLSILIEEKFHFSFPNVFAVNDIIYMIPESGEKNGIFLYKFDAYPNGIALVQKLIDGPFVDTALVEMQNNIGYFITYNPEEKTLYSLIVDFTTFKAEITLIKEDPNKIWRPAGNAFKKDSTNYIPFQNCSTKYGESILLREASVKEGNVVIEDTAREIKPVDFDIDRKAKRLHTYNLINDNCYVIDYMMEGFKLFKSFKMLKRIQRRKKHKKELGHG